MTELLARYRRLSFSLLLLGILGQDDALADVCGIPEGADFVHLLGKEAERVLAPHSGQIAALVRIPPGVDPNELGIESIAPGIGRIRGSAKTIEAFATHHPELHTEVSPPLHSLLNRAAQFVRVPIQRPGFFDGSGVAVAIADSGIDVTHPDLRRADGSTRVAWLLDLSLPPIGKHSELEAKFAIRDRLGQLVRGAVFSASDIDATMSNGSGPIDELGHGTHVASIAAGNGGGTPFVGMAPGATLLFARVSESNQPGAFEVDNLLRGVDFLFNRADAMSLPVAVNLSLGTDFGPRDGSTLWEQTIVSYLDRPGRAIVAAAGNSGSITDSPIHQSVYVPAGGTMRVPILSQTVQKGRVQIWITKRGGASIDIGLDGPNGEWIEPIAEGANRGFTQNGLNAGIINGGPIDHSALNDGRGALLFWRGGWPRGTYSVVFKGDGIADLYIQTEGDASQVPLGFSSAVRAGTIGLPAAHPKILAVGCTTNRPSWSSISGLRIGFDLPLPAEGDVCFFSSAGPNALGLPKPEITAPGGAIAAAMSGQASPGKAKSMFTAMCPPAADGQRDPRCRQVDATHAIARGTSMSAPLVTGAIALLLQRDPTLTQERIIALIQAGAHRIRGRAPYDDQSGPGELDVQAALDLLEQSGASLFVPSRKTSWLTLSSLFMPADGRTVLTASLQLRDETGKGGELDLRRLTPRALLSGRPIATDPIERHEAGFYTFTLRIDPGHGGEALIIGALFDGSDVVDPKTIPIATDSWTAQSNASIRGGCSTSPQAAPPFSPLFALLLFLRRCKHPVNRTGSILLQA